MSDAAAALVPRAGRQGLAGRTQGREENKAAGKHHRRGEGVLGLPLSAQQMAEGHICKMTSGQHATGRNAEIAHCLVGHVPRRVCVQ
jgi:predicted metal-dependent hydrolase